MRQAVLLVVSLFVHAAASDTIKPLFETDSVTTYDRWLWQHRNEYPRFRPFRARTGTEQSPSGWKRSYVISFTDSGTVQARYVYPDSWDDRGRVQQQMIRIVIAEDGDRLAVRRWYAPTAGSTAYDGSGRKLFDSDRELVPRFGLWFRDTRMSESTQVLNDSGLVIGVLPGASIRGASSSGDTLFVAPSRAGTIAFDRAARILWRDNVARAAPHVATISPDGREVAIAARDSVVLHDLVTGRTTVNGVDSATAARQGLQLIVWSNDGSKIAMYHADSDVPDSATLSILTRDGTLARPARRLARYYTERLFWMGDTVVLVASPYVPDMRKWTHDKPLQSGPCKVTAVTLSGKTHEWTVPGRFGQLGHWYQQGRQLGYVGSHIAVFQVPVQ
jgi:hypothetical protein